MNRGAKVFVLSTVQCSYQGSSCIISCTEPRILTSFALLYTVKKVCGFPVPSRDVTYQILSWGRENRESFFTLYGTGYFILRAKRIKHNLPKDIFTHLQTQGYICNFISLCKQMMLLNLIVSWFLKRFFRSVYYVWKIIIQNMRQNIKRNSQKYEEILCIST